jgi:Zn-dependent oligopeptidase
LLKGYNSFAEEQTEGAMARTPGTVETFIDSLTEKMIPHGRDEIRALTNLKRKQTGQYLVSLEPWDVLYYKNMLDEKAGLNKHEIKKYFPVKHVVHATMDLYEELLGLKFKDNKC